MKKRRFLIVLLVIMLLYIFIGFLFTVLRANSHYSYFVLEEDSLENNGMSYWQNRCIESNRENPIPMARWCIDGSGNFHTKIPTKFSWYFFFYSKKPFDILFTLIFWPLQFVGIEMIKFRGVGYGW